MEIMVVIFWVVLLFILVIFPFWMLIHSIIRTIKMWPKDNALNLIMVVLITFTTIIGAIIYYFVCYRGSKLLSNSAPVAPIS